MTIETSIIIAVHNVPTWTVKCLEYLVKYTDLDANELIIVDNGSNISTSQNLVQTISLLTGKRIKYLKNDDNCGSYLAWNQGVDASEGEFVCLLHNDTLVTENWLQPLIKTLRDDDDVETVSPMTNYANEEEYVYSNELLEHYLKCKLSNKYNLSIKELEELFEKFCGPLGFDKFAKELTSKKIGYRRTCTQIATFCCVMEKRFFESYGRFDIQFYPHLYAEKILRYRMDVNGKHSYCVGDSFVYHNGNTTSDGFEFKYPIIAEKNKELYESKMADIYEQAMSPAYLKKKINSSQNQLRQGIKPQLWSEPNQNNPT